MSMNSVLSTSCSGTCRKAIFPFSFSSWNKESDLYRGLGWGDLSVEKLIVSTREEEAPIIDLQIDERPVLSWLRIESELTTQRGDEKGTRWFTKTWVPSEAGSMVMRRHLRIRSRDLTASYPEETWAWAALSGSFSRSCLCEQRRVERVSANQPINYEAWKVRNTAQAIVAGFWPSGMDQRDYVAWKARGMAQAIAAGFWPWDQRPGFRPGGPDQRSVQDRNLDNRDLTDGLTQAECRIRWWQNRCDIDAGVPLTFAMTPAQVAVAKSSLGLLTS
jgi:hypothetical protein